MRIKEKPVKDRIKIAEIEEWEVDFVTKINKFVASDNNDNIVKSAGYTELVKKIKKHIESEKKKNTSPVDIYVRTSGFRCPKPAKKAKVTSITADDHLQVTYSDGQGERIWHDAIYRGTDKNKELFNRIGELNKKARNIEEEIEDCREKLDSFDIDQLRETMYGVENE